MEIDGASNRGIDEIRNLKENVKFTPSSSPYKIYIIDEVHMLTQEAFNALLKTLEEPPPHIRFIFATTAPHRVPLTILSRCQRFDFHRIPVPLIVKKLRQITEREGIKISEGALYSIARNADGSLRDAESILDQLVSFTDGMIEESQVDELLGKIREEILLEFLERLSAAKLAEAWRLVEEQINTGKPLEEFLNDLLRVLKNILFIKSGINELVDLEEESRKKAEEFCRGLEESALIKLLEEINLLREKVRRSDLPLLMMEVGLVKVMEILEGKREAVEIKKEERGKIEEEVYEKLKEEAKKISKTLGTILSQSKLKELHKDKLIIELPFSNHYFQKTMEKNQKKLEKWLKDEYNLSLELHYLGKEKGNRNYDKLIEKALDLFNAKVVKGAKNG